MTPKISLIIPVYNVEKYLKKCLESAVNQTLRDIEIIIINDGSTDKSLKICEEYAKKDTRIVLCTQENSGLGIARNHGIDLAKGEFVSFLDSDDWLDIKTLESSYKKALKDNADIVVFGFARISEDTGETIQTRDDFNFDLHTITKDDFYKRVIGCEFKHMACAMLVKRSLYRDNLLRFPSVLHEDLYVIPQLFYLANKVSFVNENYYHWLVREGSITTTIGSKHIDGMITAMFNTKIFLLKENIYKRYNVEFTQFYLTYLNLVYRRILLLCTDTTLQNKLIDELMHKSVALIKIQDTEKLSKEKYKRFKGFLEVFKSTIQKNIPETSCNIDEHKALQTQLEQVKNSRGYKLLLKGYRLQNRIVPLGSRRREILKFLVGKKKKPEIQEDKKDIQYYDIVFMPHKDYHVWTMGLIAEELLKHNISVCMIDLTDYYRDEGSREKAKEFPNIPFLDYKLLRDDYLDFKTLICMNDWDKRFTRPEVLKAKKAGKITIGIVEGIQDFFDLDTKQDRQTYKSVEYVFLTGEHDRQFFKQSIDKTHIIGVPRLLPLLKEEVFFPEKKLAIINMNFSYNVLTDKAEYWLKSAIEGCKKAKIDYIITQHPADNTDLSKYNVTSLDMYETIRQGSIVISRFSSTIIEALAMGKPVVYHNPHEEKALKFQDPLGAYSISFNSDELAQAIEYELGLNTDYRKRANKFLHHHCNINTKSSSIELAVEGINKINVNLLNK